MDQNNCLNKALFFISSEAILHREGEKYNAIIKTRLPDRDSQFIVCFSSNLLQHRTLRLEEDIDPLRSAATTDGAATELSNYLTRQIIGIGIRASTVSRFKHHAGSSRDQTSVCRGEETKQTKTRLDINDENARSSREKSKATSPTNHQEKYSSQAIAN